MYIIVLNRSHAELKTALSINCASLLMTVIQILLLIVTFLLTIIYLHFWQTLQVPLWSHVISLTHSGQFVDQVWSNQPITAGKRTLTG